MTTYVGKAHINSPFLKHKEKFPLALENSLYFTYFPEGKKIKTEKQHRSDF